MFFCQLWEISKTTFFTQHLWATASDIPNLAEVILALQKEKNYIQGTKSQV